MRQYVPTIRYAWLQGGFWMSFCVVFNYAGVFLLSKGYSNSEIGVIIAVAGLVSVFLQPFVAGLSDRYEKLTLRRLILGLSVIMLLAGALLIIPGLHLLWNALFYSVLLAVLQVLTPLVNAIGMECINRGISVNFGLARGIGSVSYALISFLAGELIERFSATLIPFLVIVCYLLVFAAAYIFCFPISGTKRAGQAQTDRKPVRGQAEQNPSYEEQNGESFREDAAAAAEQSFFASYRRFFILLAGISLLFICHNMLNNYLFQIMTYHHGGSSEMGIAAAISAVLELPTMIAFSFMVRRVSSGTLLKISGLFFTLKSFLTLIAAGISGVYLAQTAQMFGFALFVPASVYYVNSLIRPSDRAKGQAFMTATNTVGSVFGSLLGGFLIDSKGIPAMLLTATVIAAVGTALVFMCTEKLPENR